MKWCIFAALFGTAVASLAVPARALEPVPGSITYGGQPRTKLLKAPIGSTVTHQFYNDAGQEVHEVYRLDENRNLKLTGRRVSDLD
jgi:hypothetical protein|nr:hypothetical protein [Neorhizobium tomejilense]